MIKSKCEAIDFILNLDTYQTPEGVYVHSSDNNQYGYRGHQDVATSWYGRGEFLAVVWRDRKKINNQERNEMACAVSENK